MKQLSKKKVKQRRKKGIVKAYMSRAAAIRQLQVSLADFRRLCILKGVYPVEPRNKGKLTGANTQRKTYFFTKDIQMLMSEPILQRFMDFKTSMKRLTRAKGRHDVEAFQREMENRPFYKLDTVVKERYPRFIDALRDCDDALSMLFLFSMFPKGPGRPDDLIDHCRRLGVEFMRYVVTSHSLRKVFISIKGYYYQAEIMGQTITWIVPHQFVIERLTNVDLNVMKTFTEFYVTLMGFINFRLYKSISSAYPPEETGDIRPLPTLESKSLSKAEAADQQIDLFSSEQKGILLERLFEGSRFFLNREVPRESLAFVIQAFGGEVSWDKTASSGATFDSSDPSITHHIVDRINLEQRRVDRVYIQPQWVYDSINKQTLLPTSDYLVGATLPPHLSPFTNEKSSDKTKTTDLRKQFDAEKAEERANKSTSKSKMQVKAGKLKVEDKEDLEKKEEAEHRKMGIMMIPKKKKRLFDKIMRTQKQRKLKANKLRAKQQIVEAVKARRKQ